MIILGLGANLDSIFGAPEATIERAIDEFSRYGISVIKKSSVWKTAPVPLSTQPWYRNAVCSIKTSNNPLELLKILQKIESDFGRIRALQNAPRVIDLDILCYDNIQMDSSLLKIPHPRMQERAFVLYPLQEIEPHWMHPFSKISIVDLIALLPSEQEIELV